MLQNYGGVEIVEVDKIIMWKNYKSGEIMKNAENE